MLRQDRIAISLLDLPHGLHGALAEAILLDDLAIMHHVHSTLQKGPIAKHTRKVVSCTWWEYCIPRLSHTSAPWCSFFVIFGSFVHDCEKDMHNAFARQITVEGFRLLSEEPNIKKQAFLFLADHKREANVIRPGSRSKRGSRKPKSLLAETPVEA